MGHSIYRRENVPVTALYKIVAYRAIPAWLIKAMDHLLWTMDRLLLLLQPVHGLNAIQAFQAFYQLIQLLFIVYVYFDQPFKQTFP